MSIATPPPAVTSAPVPLVDLRAQHDEVADEVAAGFARVMARTAFVGGPDTEAFEAEYAAHVGARHCLGVANGTDALELCLRSLGIGHGDEVVVPANSFVASAEAVALVGATPVFVDCDPRHHLLDPTRLADVLTDRTRAVLPVHLYGQMAPMDAVAEVLAGRDVHVVEDAAQAQGARRHGVAAGSAGTAAGTSFYPGKNLGAYGDGGAVTTDDDGVAARIRAMRQHGAVRRYEHELLGRNSRLDTLQAVVLRAKLARLATWNQARRDAAARYDELLEERVPSLERPGTMAGNEHVWHLYVVRVRDRDTVLDGLHELGIGAGVHYPRPLHLLPPFRHLGHGRGDFPVTEDAATRILSLPLFPHITLDQQLRVVDALARVLR